VTRQVVLVLACALLCGAGKPVLTSRMSALANHIQPEALRGDVQFLASDLLEGRDTPSRGLDVAGEFLAAQFQSMGLEPAVENSPTEKNGYFQTVVVQPKDPESPKSRNVAAVLPGSDPVLRNTYVMLTAHYDHLGLAKTGVDRVFNGANDNASGTASVVEIARAFAALRPRPKRSVLFVLFCCEEKGLRGSIYYAAHPLKPLEQTIAQINLEQMGRTDSTEGPHVKAANITGFDFSSVTQTIVQAGEREGVQITKDPKGSEPYFNLSDNAPLARAGVPAHTVSVTYEYPDYHAVGDEWQKLDYNNMAQVDRAIGIAVLDLASAQTEPRWNEAHPAAKVYVEAGQKLHAK
jgi:hypothetical protein